MDELSLLSLAPSPDVFDAGAKLADRGLKDPRRSSDARLLFARCEGSGGDYEVSALLAAPERPRTRCSCPSRANPCKHALALLVAYVRDAGRFVEAEVPAALADLDVPAPVKAPRSGKKGAPNVAAQAKKARAQLDGLSIAERVLVDLATTGLGSVDAERRAALADRAREIADAHLPGVSLGLRRLARVLEPGAECAPDMARASRALARLWAMVRKGRALLEQKIDEGQDSAAESDAVLEELLGKVWQLAELRDQGFVRSELALVELAFGRIDDPDREERLEWSVLVDLASGEVLRDVSYVPSRRIGKEPPKPSHEGVLVVKEAAVYPGLANRRVRWEKDAARPRDLEPGDLERLGAVAIGVADAMARFTKQRKNLLAPDELVVLLGPVRFGRAGGAALLEDAAGQRIAIGADASSQRALSILELHGWPPGARAVLADLSVDGGSGLTVACPLAVVATGGVLRLGT